MDERQEDSASQARQAATLETATEHAVTEETVVAPVAPYWTRPHGRVRGVLTGHRP
jgi:hypothetical protein